ncbi:NAD(P)-binding protein [Hyaloscypha variabilis F]|uniref:NAD(P)-binding protein n=1 Tax=Hyaloscypha variabilis (strain UAMH 11265 / GT02V1 / F) TaxID=1149755 RepID=A0A2J6S7Z8_HYAVF|nr:NAD(P)-binding protein [Hyaloscypha variabilis F]
MSKISSIGIPTFDQMSQPPSRKVLVIIGAGGMGLPLARRLGSGRHILLGDFSPTVLSAALTTLHNEGHTATSQTLDIASYTSVFSLAATASALGPIAAIIHTAGVAPGSATAKQIFEINLLGTANVIQAFLPVVDAGTSLVCIASMAGSMVPLSSSLETHLATASLDTLLQHAEINVENEDPGMAYGMSKRGNQLRVQSAAKSWGRKGARVNSVSPGIISTALVQGQLAAPGGDRMREMIEGSAVGKIGTVGDVEGVVAFLVGEEAKFVTGVDLLVDGGGSGGMGVVRMGFGI